MVFRHVIGVQPGNKSGCPGNRAQAETILSNFIQTRKRPVMLKNYLHYAWANIKRNKIFSFTIIRIVGMNHELTH